VRVLLEGKGKGLHHLPAKGTRRRKRTVWRSLKRSKEGGCLLTLSRGKEKVKLDFGPGSRKKKGGKRETGKATRELRLRLEKKKIRRRILVGESPGSAERAM